MRYVWQAADWPNFHWDRDRLSPLLTEVARAQGRLVGRAEALGYKVRENLLLQTLTQDVVKTSEIEGDHLDEQQVRSSIACRLGIEIERAIPAERRVEGIVEMTLDAVRDSTAPLTEERLYRWHASLFPTGRNEWGQRIAVGAWRDDAKGPMTVSSGPHGRERVHYIAPPAESLPDEMSTFLKWFNDPDDRLHPIMKASTAHFWFVAIHPFDDGNGRVTRAISDMMLARGDLGNQRLYSMSAQIQREQKGYYTALERASGGERLDLTEWHVWYLDCLDHAVAHATSTLDNVLLKAAFWERNRDAGLNDRQTKVLNRVMEGFEGKLTSSKWAKLTKASQDTANRDIADLLDKGILRKGEGGGRSTNYEIVLEELPEDAARPESSAGFEP